MNISKLSALWSLITGGWAGLAVYLLEVVNNWLATLDKTRLAEASKIINSVCSAMTVLLNTFLPVEYKSAAYATIKALDGLADALADGELTKDELDVQIDLVESCIVAWKEIGR